MASNQRLQSRFAGSRLPGRDCRRSWTGHSYEVPVNVLPSERLFLSLHKPIEMLRLRRIDEPKTIWFFVFRAHQSTERSNTNSSNQILRGYLFDDEAVRQRSLSDSALKAAGLILRP